MESATFSEFTLHKTIKLGTDLGSLDRGEDAIHIYNSLIIQKITGDLIKGISVLMNQAVQVEKVSIRQDFFQESFDNYGIWELGRYFMNHWPIDLLARVDDCRLQVENLLGKFGIGFFRANLRLGDKNGRQILAPHETRSIKVGCICPYDTQDKATIGLKPYQATYMLKPLQSGLFHSFMAYTHSPGESDHGSRFIHHPVMYGPVIVKPGVHVSLTVPVFDPKKARSRIPEAQTVNERSKEMDKVMGGDYGIHKVNFTPAPFKTLNSMGPTIFLCTYPTAEEATKRLTKHIVGARGEIE